MTDTSNPPQADLSFSLCTVNGHTVNGLTVNGCTVNGRTLNGRTVNGGTVNGGTVNGGTVNLRRILSWESISVNGNS